MTFPADICHPPCPAHGNYISGISFLTFSLVRENSHVTDSKKIFRREVETQATSKNSTDEILGPALNTALATLLLAHKHDKLYKIKQPNVHLRLLFD